MASITSKLTEVGDDVVGVAPALVTNDNPFPDSPVKPIEPTTDLETDLANMKLTTPPDSPVKPSPETDSPKPKSTTSSPEKPPTFETRRVFVGGLPPKCRAADLALYFKKFGHVLETQVMLHPVYKHSRGFGYVTFEHPECVDSVLANSQKHHIQNRWIECKRCHAPEKERPLGTCCNAVGEQNADVWISADAEITMSVAAQVSSPLRQYQSPTKTIAPVTPYSLRSNGSVNAWTPELRKNLESSGMIPNAPIPLGAARLNPPNQVSPAGGIKVPTNSPAAPNQQWSPEKGADVRGVKPTIDGDRMFVGGLLTNTYAYQLVEEFAKWGLVKEAMVMLEPSTGAPRGFGYVTFAQSGPLTPSAQVKNVVNHVKNGGIIKVRGKRVDCDECFRPTKPHVLERQSQNADVWINPKVDKPGVTTPTQGSPLSKSPPLANVAGNKKVGILSEGVMFEGDISKHAFHQPLEVVYEDSPHPGRPAPMSSGHKYKTPMTTRAVVNPRTGRRTDQLSASTMSSGIYSAGTPSPNDAAIQANRQNKFTPSPQYDGINSKKDRRTHIKKDHTKRRLSFGDRSAPAVTAAPGSPPQKRKPNIRAPKDDKQLNAVLNAIVDKHKHAADGKNYIPPKNLAFLKKHEENRKKQGKDTKNFLLGTPPQPRVPVEPNTVPVYTPERAAEDAEVRSNPRFFRATNPQPAIPAKKNDNGSAPGLERIQELGEPHVVTPPSSPPREALDGDRPKRYFGGHWLTDTALGFILRGPPGLTKDK